MPACPGKIGLQIGQMFSDRLFRKALVLYRFEQEEENSLEEQIMSRICKEIALEWKDPLLSSPKNLEEVQGSEWYEAFKDQVLQMVRSGDSYEISEKYPACEVLLYTLNLN